MCYIRFSEITHLITKSVLSNHYIPMSLPHTPDPGNLLFLSASVKLCHSFLKGKSHLRFCKTTLVSWFGIFLQWKKKKTPYWTCAWTAKDTIVTGWTPWNIQSTAVISLSFSGFGISRITRSTKMVLTQMLPYVHIHKSLAAFLNLKDIFTVYKQSSF